jgi:hypothetical protein
MVPAQQGQGCVIIFDAVTVGGVLGHVLLVGAPSPR